MSEPPIRIREIIFDDETHFLDHAIGSRYCWSRNSTRRKSLRLHWRYLRDYKHTWDQRLLHRVFGCWLGRHEMMQWYNRDGKAKARLLCEWCDREEYVG